MTRKLSRVGEVLSPTLTVAQILPFLARHYPGVTVPPGRPTRMVGGRNSTVFRVGPYVFKEIRRRDFIADPERYARKYRFLERLAARYPLLLPLPTSTGERFVLEGGRLYEVQPFLTGTRPWRLTNASHTEAASELARFHAATRGISGRHLIDDNDVYRGTLEPFEGELDRYAGAIARRRDRVSLYLRRYLDDVVSAYARLRRVRREWPHLTRGVIHRDLHPANVLRQQGRILLLDYDSITVHEQILDVVFMMDRMVMNAAHPDGPPTRSRLRKADEFLDAYTLAGGHLRPTDVEYAMVVLGEEYLKRTSSILRKHFRLGPTQDLPNLQRQDLRRLPHYADVLAKRTGGAPVRHLLEDTL